MGRHPSSPPPDTHTGARTHTHTFGRGKLRPGRERTPAKVTSGGGAGSGSGSVRPWTPRPAGPTRKGRALRGSARAPRLRAPRGRSGRAGRGCPSQAGLCGPRRASGAAVVSSARAQCGLADSGDPAPPALQAGRCGAARGGPWDAAEQLRRSADVAAGCQRSGWGRAPSTPMRFLPLCWDRAKGSPCDPCLLSPPPSSTWRNPASVSQSPACGREGVISISGICSTLLDAPGSG